MYTAGFLVLGPTLLRKCCFFCFEGLRELTSAVTVEGLALSKKYHSALNGKDNTKMLSKEPIACSGVNSTLCKRSSVESSIDEKFLGNQNVCGSSIGWWLCSQSKYFEASHSRYGSSVRDCLDDFTREPYKRVQSLSLYKRSQSRLILGLKNYMQSDYAMVKAGLLVGFGIVMPTAWGVQNLFENNKLKALESRILEAGSIANETMSHNSSTRIISIAEQNLISHNSSYTGIQFPINAG